MATEISFCVGDYVVSNQTLPHKPLNLLNYDKTDTSHLTDKDYEKYFLKLIEIFHFNPENFENIKIILEK